VRSWIGLLPPGAKYDQGIRHHTNWGDFRKSPVSAWNDVYHGPKLAALIVREEWTEEPDAGGTNDVSRLIIWRVDAAKLDQPCPIGQTTSNEEARAIAGDLSKPCLEN